MKYLIVRCTLARLLTEPQRFEAMQREAARMQRHEVTGLSLLSGPAVMHYLEGPGEGVTAVGVALEQDPLYRGTRIVAQGSLRYRRCRSWQMAFAACPPVEHPSYSPLLGDRAAPWPAALQEAPELAVLRSFRAGAAELAPAGVW